MADVAPLRAAHEARLPDRVGREVVVVHVAALRLEREVVDPLALLGGAEGEQRHDLRLAAREERRAVRARADADLARDRADLLGAAPVGAALVDRDLPPDELLVDRLGGLLHVLPRHRVLDRRRLRVGGRGPDRERQLDLLLDPAEEQAALRRAGAPSSPARRRSARAGRPRTGRATGPRTASSRWRSRMIARLDRTWIWRRMSSSVESIESAGASSATSSSTTAPASRRPSARDPLLDAGAVLAPRAAR